MDCQLCREQLSAYLDGELKPPEAREVEEHLTRCRPCRGEFSGLKRVRELVAALPRENAPAGLADDVASQIERRALLAPEFHERRTGALKRSLGVLAAVAAMALAVFGVYHFFIDKSFQQGPLTISEDLSHPAVVRQASRPSPGEPVAVTVDGKGVGKVGKDDQTVALHRGEETWSGDFEGIDAFALRLDADAPLMTLELAVDDIGAARARIVQIAHEASVGEGKLLRGLYYATQNGEDFHARTAGPVPGVGQAADHGDGLANANVVTLVVAEEKVPELVKELMASRGNFRTTEAKEPARTVTDEDLLKRENEEGVKSQLKKEVVPERPVAPAPVDRDDIGEKKRSISEAIPTPESVPAVRIAPREGEAADAKDLHDDAARRMKAEAAPALEEIDREKAKADGRDEEGRSVERGRAKDVARFVTLRIVLRDAKEAAATKTADIKAASEAAEVRETDSEAPKATETEPAAK